MRAIHDSEIAARVLGVDVARKKLTVFVISAVYASVAGSYLALFNGHITPDVAGFLRSIELVAMVVLGGMGSIVGSLVGAAVLVVLPQTLTFLHEYEHLVLGLILMGVHDLPARGHRPEHRGGVRGTARHDHPGAENAVDCVRRRARGRRCEPRDSGPGWCSRSSGRTGPARPRCST